MTEYDPTGLGPEKDCRFYQDKGRLCLDIHQDERMRLGRIIIKGPERGWHEAVLDPDGLEGHARDCLRLARWLRENR